VPESVENPLLYYRNNLESLMNLLEACKQFSIPYFCFLLRVQYTEMLINLPVTEDAPMQKAESPYAHTKQIGEAIITDFAKTSTTQFVLLRYFNPVGAHTLISLEKIHWVLFIMLFQELQEQRLVNLKN
jgi:UDP-glucose 4-epimerase